MFTATFTNVVAVIDRTITAEGRAPRLSEYKNRRVAVVILEDFAYPEKTTQRELGEDYDLPTEKLVELTNSEMSNAFDDRKKT